VIAVITALAALLSSVGADSRWLAALGHSIWSRGAIPTGIPFAAAPSAHWPNALVLAELCIHGLEAAFGDRGLILAQLAAVTAAMALLARDARDGGASGVGTAGVLLAVALGTVPSLAIARVQLFSLVLFPALVLLLRAEARKPSNKIWLALPLLALWANLHGAVLAGLAVLYAFLALNRFRTDRRGAVGVALGALVAISLTPAGIHTVDYYRGLLTNVAAERGEGLWAPLGSDPFDFVMIAVALSFAWKLRRARPPLWELATVAGLTVLTLKAGRDGVWLLFFLAAPVARSSRARRAWNGLLPLGLAAAILLLAVSVAREPLGGAPPALVTRAIALAHGTPVLADAIVAEQVALRGGRIWIGDPIDAFDRADQSSYLDWIDGSKAGRAALSQRVDVVLAQTGSAASRLTVRDGAFTKLASGGAETLYVRSR
jgi:hypothetical protein